MFKENKQFTQKNINNILVFEPNPKIPRCLSIQYLIKVDRIKFVKDKGSVWMLVRNLEDKYNIVDCFGENDEERIAHWFVYKDERK
jgi:hypothetical protein